MVYTLEVSINLSVLVVCTTRTISAPALRVSGLFYALKMWMAPVEVDLVVLCGQAVPALSAETDASLSATSSEGHSDAISLARLKTSPQTP